MIVEIVGLPGVGKTTLTSALCSSRREIQLAKTPYFRDAMDVPFFLLNTLKLFPLFLKIIFANGNRTLNKRDCALMVILNGWSGLLKRQRAFNNSLLLLDEGPICYLTRLRAWGSAGTHCMEAKNWWDQMFQVWATTIDLVIHVDATDGVLIERIRSREMRQEVKAMSADEAFEYMKNLRAAQEYVLQEISIQTDSPEKICFDSRLYTPDQLCRQVTALLPI
jgi:hypothetical protein